MLNKIPIGKLLRYFTAGYKGELRLDDAFIKHIYPHLKKYITPKYKHVATHKRMDADALCCICLGETYTLIDGNATSFPKGATVLDHPLGIKGSLSAFGTVCKTPDWLVREVNCADSGLPIEGTLTVVEWIKNDNLTYQIICQGEALCNKKPEKITGVTHRVGKYLFLEGGSTGNVIVSNYLKERMGVVGIVYQKGNNIGISKFPGVDGPNLEPLSRLLPDWYLSSTGHFLGYGSKKVPAKKPPKRGDPKTIKDLLSLLEQVI